MSSSFTSSCPKSINILTNCTLICPSLIPVQVLSLSGTIEEMLLGDAGLGTARMSMQDEPKGVPINRATSINDHLFTAQLGHRFGIQPSVSSSFLLALAHVATQSNDSETASFPKLQNPRYVSDFHLPLELPGL
ncbi:hypothetical protein L6452_22898 [Arctium lappa]|uniref:Uncharacterized protein n=1 Tax=Arctium lappa TaxID=4217 RepID=A0ACB9B2S9_ARCLA|nr:hypothetical protein L6452_22898 [Arctium lappa]